MKNIGIDLGSRYVKLVKEDNGNIEYKLLTFKYFLIKIS